MIKIIKIKVITLKTITATMKWDRQREARDPASRSSGQRTSPSSAAPLPARRPPDPLGGRAARPPRTIIPQQLALKKEQTEVLRKKETGQYGSEDERTKAKHENVLCFIDRIKHPARAMDAISCSGRKKGITAEGK